jgi:hypothetical protein
MLFEMMATWQVVVAEMKSLRCETINKLILLFIFHFHFYRFIKNEIIRGGGANQSSEVMISP